MSAKLGLVASGALAFGAVSESVEYAPAASAAPAVADTAGAVPILIAGFACVSHQPEFPLAVAGGSGPEAVDATASGEVPVLSVPGTAPGAGTGTGGAAAGTGTGTAAAAAAAAGAAAAAAAVDAAADTAADAAATDALAESLNLMQVQTGSTYSEFLPALGVSRFGFA
eukprot:COSAG02_NODE_2448_length_8837_cov_38.266880_4_plen_169_part_00